MSLLNFMLVLFGHETIYGVKGGGLNKIKNEIKEYNTFAVLESISKISLTLFSKGVSNRQSQIELIRDVFAGDKFSKDMIIRALESENKDYWIIFTDQALLMLFKIVLEETPMDSGKSVTPTDVWKIGVWLLILNDEISSLIKQHLSQTYLKEEIEEHRKFLAVQYFFNAKERLPYRITRFNAIFNLIKQNNHGLDVDHLFLKATKGISFGNYVALSFSLLIHWMSKTNKKPNLAKGWIICRDKYFKKTEISMHQINKILSLLSCEAKTFLSEYHKVVNELLSGQDIYAYNFLPLQQRPLFKFNKQCYICLSPNFLMDKVSEGVYWLLENYLKENKLEEERRLLPIVWGDAFEVYINTRLINAFGKSKFIGKYFFKGKERADGIICGDNIICIIETKYCHWSFKAKLTGSMESMEPTLNQLFSGGERPKGLGQISKNLKDLENGNWELPFKLEDRKILPIIIVGEPMPLDFYNRKLYEDFAKEKGALYSNDITLPFIILDAEEIEMLESIALKQGKKVAENLLLLYSDLFRERNYLGYPINSLSFKNFLDEKGHLVPNNPQVFKDFNHIAKEIQLKLFPSGVLARKTKKDN